MSTGPFPVAQSVSSEAYAGPCPLLSTVTLFASLLNDLTAPIGYSWRSTRGKIARIGRGFEGQRDNPWLARKLRQVPSSTPERVHYQRLGRTS